ncbi:MAG TPA: SdpI family protein [Candidatus Hydrogenedentes bacterium]|nr:SdpI family protein [Candidatus Hydrogenedentota bacterium]
MPYIDRPSASKAYLATVLGILLLCLLPAALMLAAGPTWMMYIVLPLYSLVMLALLLMLIQAAFMTEYRIEEDAVYLRCGWLWKKRVPFSEIRSVMPVKRISRVLGWNPGALGYCNRYTNGLLLITKTVAISISPGDVEAFRAVLPSFPESNGIPSELIKEPLWTKRFIALVFAAQGILIIALAIPMITGIVPPNSGYGVRTTATMSNPDIWYPANRFGGGCLAAAGIVTLLVSLVMLAYARKLNTWVVTLICFGSFLLCIFGTLAGTLYYTDRLENGPFVTDPDMIGHWTCVDYVPTVDAFQPGKKLAEGDLFLKELTFKANGTTSGVWRWSKGVYWHPDELRKDPYEIRTVNGTKFLFLKWVNGDVLYRGQPAYYYVFTQ